MSDFPRMLYRKGEMLPDHGLDYCIVQDADEETAALKDGWQASIDPLDHDGDGKKGGARESDGPPPLTNKPKAELLEIAEAEGVDVSEDATNKEIKAAIEAARAD